MEHGRRFEGPLLLRILDVDVLAEETVNHIEHRISCHRKRLRQGDIFCLGVEYSSQRLGAASSRTGDKPLVT